jgi:alpha-glucosidase
LLPYLYACFLEASETGAPVQRPLVFDHQYDATVRDIDDQYLLGRDLLIAPVVGPGVTGRQVYLPDGDWYDWHTGELVAGKRFLTVVTPLDRIPIFARAGAVIPMWPEAPVSTNDYHPTVVQLHLFVPASDGVYYSRLQEDDGLTFAALRGARYHTTFTVERAASELTLRAEVSGDGYPEFSRERLVLVLHGAAPDAGRLDEDLITGTNGRFEIPNRGTSFTFACTVPQ